MWKTEELAHGESAAPDGMVGAQQANEVVSDESLLKEVASLEVRKVPDGEVDIATLQCCNELLSLIHI